jgi:hypothetical protein
MLIILRTSYVIENANELETMSSEDLHNIRKEDSEKGLNFAIPYRLESTRLKNTYKSGFLFSFYRLLYPDKKVDAIVTILQEKYDVFMVRRQLERNLKLYQEDAKFIN